MNILRFIVPKSMVEYIRSDSSVRQTLEKMRYHRYTALPVLDAEGRYIGTVRNDDLLVYFLENNSFDTREAEKDSVLNVLQQNAVKPLYHNATMQELIEQVREHNFVPVVDDRGCFIGLILRREVLNYLLAFYKSETGE